MTVRYDRKRVAGQHVVTSPDVPELYSAHPDLAGAERDAAVAVLAIERAKKRIAGRTARRATA